jgi:transmembrane sensor
MKKPAAPPTGAPESAASSVDSGLQALAWAVSAGAAEQVITQVRARQRRRRRRRLVALAGTAAGLIFGLAFWRTPPPAATADSPVPSTRTAIVSAPASQVLPDGSVVEFKEGAVLAVEFGRERRRVVLKAGEAHFQVVKDPLRPFVVSAEGIEVRAVGTAFAVQLGARAVDVIVTEGRVAVERTPTDAAGRKAGAPTGGEQPHPALPSGPDAVLVSAGNRVTVTHSSPTVAPPVVAVSASEMERRLAWRVPRLEFSGTPLGEAIPMFNQHGRLRLTLDPALHGLQLSGLLRADDTESLLLLLRNEFGIEPEPRGDGALFLRRR